MLAQICWYFLEVIRFIRLFNEEKPIGGEGFEFCK
jgi:hypothetical protein